MPVKEEIISGLKNALTRGESIEKAIQSFVNAGYTPQEVQQAADEVKRSGEVGLTGVLQDLEGGINGNQLEAPEQSQTLESGQQQSKEQVTTTLGNKKKKRLWKAIILTIILLLLITTLGIMFFGEKLLNALF